METYTAPAAATSVQPAVTVDGVRRTVDSEAVATVIATVSATPEVVLMSFMKEQPSKTK